MGAANAYHRIENKTSEITMGLVSYVLHKIDVIQ